MTARDAGSSIDLPARDDLEARLGLEPGHPAAQTLRMAAVDLARLVERVNEAVKADKP